MCNYNNYLAKTFKIDDKVYAGRNVFDHCVIVGEICKSLISQMPENLKKFFNDSAPFLASLHDIGKVSPTFQKKISNNIENHPLKDELKSINPEIEKGWGGHAGAGEITLEHIIDNYKLDYHKKEYKYLPLIAGLHHGFKHSHDDTMAIDECLGDEYWNNIRIKHFEKLKEYFKCNLEPLNDESLITIMIGLTVVSDWIGSGRLFDDPEKDYKPLVDEALKEIGFRESFIKQGLSFNDIFGFEERNSQLELINICDTNGVYILEAPMGVGKTEAALYCAYKILEKGMARGIYFALPTQTTSNKIYDRFKPFIEKISLNDELVGLLHTNGKMYKFGSDADFGKSWFDSSKKGLLSPFAVGTIDQALMSVMNVKHYPVRAFGLFGKVVILDEVHSYDTYTGTILDKLVENLKNIGCTVIILSATLTKERKEEIIKNKTNNNNYPLITADKNNILYEKDVEYNDTKEVIIKYSNTSDCLNTAIEAAEKGLQVLWIENTVNKAQEIYSIIKSSSNIECGLIHSRFIRKDRQEHEEKWINILSKNNEDRYKNGRILVGTQVLEQSIDIDADLLITRHAPIDFLFQRIGRLHRHNIKRINNIKPECIIIENEKNEFSDSVYSQYVLERTKEVLINLNKISIPQDIRPLIEDTYKNRSDDNDKEKLLLKYKNILEEKKKKLKNLALHGITKLTKITDDNKAMSSTRYSEQDTINLLLIKSYNGNRITFLNDITVDLSDDKLYINKYENLRIINENIVSVSEKYAPKEVPVNISKLKDYIYIDSNFRIAKVDDGLNIVCLDGQKANDKYNLKYNCNLGYIVEKIGEVNNG